MTEPTQAAAAAAELKHVDHVIRNRKWFLWPIRFLLDKNDDLSATRIMAFLLWVTNLWGHPMEPWTAAVVIATLFGYSMFRELVMKTNMSAAATGAVNLTASLTRNLTENIQKTFAYTQNGEPAKSLPAQPDARTTGGEE